MEQKIAKALLEIGAVKIITGEPVKFDSGILSPIYTDNRIFPFHTKQWHIVISAFSKIISEKKIKFDVIAGIATAGIPHSAALGFFLKKPSVFIRKEAKEHGLKKRVEGGNVSGKRVLLVEDLVSTGRSSISGAQALRDEGAIVTDCMIIVSYDFSEARELFSKSNVQLHALTTFPHIAKEALEQKLWTQEQTDNVLNWHNDPWKWTKKH